MDCNATDNLGIRATCAPKRTAGRRLAGPAASAAAVLALVLPASAAAQPEAPPPPPPPPPAGVTVTVGPQPPPPPPPPGYYGVYAGPRPQRFVRWGGDIRLAYGIPTGNVFPNQPLSNVASGLYHVQGSGDLVILNRFVLGGNVGGGIASPGSGFASGCDAAGGDCTVWNFDIGAHFAYRFFPPPSWVDPWVELGVSYELLGVSESDAAGDNVSASFGGVDVDFTAGCDFQLGPFGLGPFITYRWGRYTSTSLTEDGVPVDSGEVTQTASHGWVLLGVRARY